MHRLGVKIDFNKRAVLLKSTALLIYNYPIVWMHKLS